MLNPTLLLVSSFLAVVFFFLTGSGDAARTASNFQTPSTTNNWAKQLKGHKSVRPCFICPGSSIISPDRFDAEYNGVDAQHRTVRMPEPVVRPCLYSNNKAKMKSVGTQVVRGPQPGTLLDQGTMHRVVVRVAYQMDNNMTSDNSAVRPHHAYCRYTLQVMPSSDQNREPVRLCRPPPSPDHGRVTCSSVGDDVSITNCRYTCDEGYLIPKSDRHLVNQDWDCYKDPATNRPPKCIKFQIPVPLDSSQCSGLNLTVPDFDDVHLDLPKFQIPSTNQTAVYVTCDVNLVQKLATTDASIESSIMIFKRHCLARNNETDAKFNCHYDVRLTLNADAARSVMTAELRFQIAHLLPNSPSTWCDDKDVVERLMDTAKTELVRVNAEACRTANCSLLTAQCHHQVLNSSSNVARGDVLNLAWTVAASYQPFSYDDYFYEGAEVPEGEMLIEKIKAETEVLVKTDLDFRRKIEAAGGHLLEKTFQLGKLDLICPLPGYIVNASTNNCQKCPANSFQLKAVCQPCPEGTFQDRAGQTECRSCRNRSSMASEHYNSRCRHRASRPVHPFVVGLAKLPNRKSWPASPSGGRQSSNGKLGNVAAAHTLSSERNNKPMTEAKYKKFQQFQQSSLKNRRHYSHPYQLATGRTTGKMLTKSLPTNDTIEDDDPCFPNPCLAGGTCFRAVRYDNNQIVSSFKCSCRLGTTGIHCETPHCPALYCLNGGTCHLNHRWQSKGILGRDLLNCTCPLGFTGSRCEHKSQNRLNPIKLRHRQHRADWPLNSEGDVTQFNKTIAKGAGLMGAHCASNPCRNGGRCVDNSHASPAPGFFTCHCPADFQGHLCDYRPCPASVGRTACPTSPSRRHPSSGRKRHQCWIQTSTGRRQCWPPPSSKTYKPSSNT